LNEIETKKDMPIAEIDGIEPFDFIQKFGDDYLHYKFPHGRFEGALEYLRGVKLSDVPFSKEEMQKNIMVILSKELKILKLIVERYIKDPIPVGSKVISRELNCSSATVRNEMGELEKHGLLEKTHTSSGRVPSEAGYRYYVDNLMELKKMNGEDMLKLQIVFRNQQLALSDVITKSLQVISDMMNYTTVVLGSKSHENLLKQVEVIPIDEENLTVIIVTDKGHVEHKNIKLQNVSLDEIKKTVSLINNLIALTDLNQVHSLMLNILHILE